MHEPCHDEGVTITVSVDVNADRKSTTFKVDNVALKGMPFNEFVDRISAAVGYCGKQVAVEHYKEIWNKLNGLQKLKKTLERNEIPKHTDK